MRRRLCAPAIAHAAYSAALGRTDQEMWIDCGVVLCGERIVSIAAAFIWVKSA